MREIGYGLYGFVFAHAVRVDADDNIWVVDEGSDMVIKFSPEGKVMMTIGRRPEAQGLRETPPRGAPRPEARQYNFGRPTDIGWDPQGNIFVSDGYINSRVVKYDPEGRYLGEVGTRGSEIGQMSTPHTMQVDAEGNVFVGDRGNRRIQVFDNEGNYLSEWPIPGPNQSVIDDNGMMHTASGSEVWISTLDGKHLGAWGERGEEAWQFTGGAHGLCIDSAGAVYVGQVAAENGLNKFARV